MHYFEKFPNLELTDSCVTIGSYDGIHLGHQKIVNTVLNNAREKDIPSVVVTFFPNPKAHFKKIEGPYYLTTPEDKARILEEMGVDYVITFPFNQSLANLRAEEFITKLRQQIHFSKLVVGYDFALGKDRSGNYERLIELGNANNYSVERINPVEFSGKTISSSWIRSLLADGDVSTAAKLFGRPYRVHGEVVSGDGRGSQIGIPTANLDIWPQLATIKQGVYACHAIVDGNRYQAVTNIGLRPTFENDIVSIRVETHILDFSQNLYGKVVSLEFIEYLRPEQKFAGIDQLVAQIQTDITKARKILG